MPRRSKKTAKTVATLTHQDASRKNIPTAEFQSVMREEEHLAAGSSQTIALPYYVIWVVWEI